MEHLTREDLAEVLSGHEEQRQFGAVLERLDRPAALVRVLGHYIYFNSIFGGGVANLAGEVAVRQDLFRDPDEPVSVLADRSVDVASDIFFAAVDEFDDRIAPYRDTHRSLAQATLKAAGMFFGCEGEALDRLTRPNAGTLEAARNVREGYAVNQPVDDAKIFRAMGFHLGSELLADAEFNVLDRHLRRRHPDLVAYLEQATVEIGRVAYPAYFWVRVHTAVEADHFEAAVKGINTSLRYYAGDWPGAQIKARVIGGLSDFASVQGRFMARLLEDGSP